MILSVIDAIWGMVVLSAPGLVLGFGLAGVLHVLVPQRLIKGQLQKPGILSTLKAAAFGVPLPLCSCSVIPVGVALRKGGASKGATSAFMISTPEIGVDSIFLSYMLLGPFIAGMRVAASFAAALGVGLAVDWLDPETARPPRKSLTLLANGSDSEPPPLSLSGFKAALRYGYVELMDDLVMVLLWGFVSAGIISALVPDDTFTRLQLPPLVLTLLMILVAMPMYVCATSSTPLAMAFLIKGVPAGAVLAFMLAGPASNITTMLAIRKEISGRALAIYLTGITITTLMFSVLTDTAVAAGWVDLSFLHGAHAHTHGSESGTLYAVVFLTLFGAAVVRRMQRGVGGNGTPPVKPCCQRGQGA